MLRLHFAVITILATIVCSSLNAQTDQTPVKVFILAGQSNMQGHAHVRTLTWLASDSATDDSTGDFVEADGSFAVHPGVNISLLSSNRTANGILGVGFGANEEKIGPELAFGVHLQKKLKGERFLIIKTAWGGKSLHTDFRPPSAGAFEFSQQQIIQLEKQKKDVAAMKAEKEKVSGQYYRMMIDHVQKILADPPSGTIKPGQELELSGFVWFQGWNDMVDGGVYPERGKPGGYDEYSQLLSHLIRDVRKDLKSPELPFVIGVMGVGGPTKTYEEDQQRHKAVHQGFRDAMAAPSKMPEFKDSVAAVFTEEYWDGELGRLVRKREKLSNDVRRRVREGSLSKSERKQELERLLAENFSAKELELLSGGSSNAAYHYLGSAKIMLGIGSGFAESMHKLLDKKSASKR